MKRIILILLLVISLSTGCSISDSVDNSISPEPEIETVPVQNVTEPVELPDELPSESSNESNIRTEVIDDTKINFIEGQGIPELTEGFGIYGASVVLEGVYPGWIGTIPITLVNGQDEERLFVIYPVSPSKPKAGFEALPEEYLCWLTIEEPTCNVQKGQIHQVNITLEMPLDADYAGKQAEVRIRVDDTSQNGLVQIALESKWYIITAD